MRRMGPQSEEPVSVQHMAPLSGVPVSVQRMGLQSARHMGFLSAEYKAPQWAQRMGSLPAEYKALQSARRTGSLPAVSVSAQCTEAHRVVSADCLYLFPFRLEDPYSCYPDSDPARLQIQFSGLYSCPGSPSAGTSTTGGSGSITGTSSGTGT